MQRNQLKNNMMKTTFKRVEELLENQETCPLPLSVIPNHMGINLVSVDAVSWQKQEDGQLVNFTIHFKPTQQPEQPKTKKQKG